MVRFPVRGLQLSAIALAMTSAGFSAWAAADYAPRRAEVLRAEAGRPLADARQGTPAQAVAAVLRSRGRDAASLAALRQSETRNGRAGMKHLRFEQTVDGMPVYGAYAKAAFDRQGNLVQVIDRLARVPAQALKAPKVEPLQALRNAMTRVHPGVAASFSLKSSGNGVAVFDGGAFFDEAPTVISVVVPLSDGSMARGYLVETWSLAGNQLHHTLVSGDGSVLNVQKRTATDSYNVFPVDPGKGPQQVVNGPGTGNAESPIGWLDGTVDKSTNISGNNVNAYLDADANNRADSGGTRNRTGNFLTASSLGTAPSTTSNKAVAVQNLFYLNNVVHDILYRHGFDEAAGNFQVDNFGKGGAGADAVRAEAQDGGGTDNANFATPPDGRKPRMQMYLWTGAGFTHELAVSSPSPVTYGAMGAQFGPALNTTGLTGSIATTSPADGCAAISTVLTGKVALIDRGTCSFTIKVANAQAAGAIGAVIANNQGGTVAFTMGGTDASLTIPSVMVTQNDGATLKTLASPAGTMRAKAVQPLQIDASLDSDIVFHEYGHGLTWRMIGDMGGKLSGAIGEGASDAVSMLINGDDKVAEYSISNPNGIRRFPYAGYPLTYANVDGGEVHNDGEIYAAIIWRLIDVFGVANRSKLMDYFVDGMNFTPADPAYEDMRDGILQSVAFGPTPSDACTVWSAFAQFGVGVGASGTVSPGGVVTVVPSFTLPPECTP